MFETIYLFFLNEIIRRHQNFIYIFFIFINAHFKLVIGINYFMKLENVIF